MRNFKPTAAERREIEAAFNLVATICDRSHSDAHALRQHVKVETHGAGFAGDRIPSICAQWLIVRWFREGVLNPDARMVHTFRIRPAALFAQGLGAEQSAHLTLSQRLTVERGDLAGAAVSSREYRL